MLRAVPKRFQLAQESSSGTSELQSSSQSAAEENNR